MGSTLGTMKHQWREFKHDEPGHRFHNQRERMEQCSHGVRVAGLVLGLLLVAGGVVLLFIPGPGLLLIVFGVALLATHSRKLADACDRIEPKLRHGGHRAKERWAALPGAAKLSVMLGLAALAAAACLFMWKFVVSAYVLDYFA